MTSEFAFVLGTGRCGSTLVQEVIARHPDTAFISNVDDRLRIPRSASRWNGAIYRSLPPSFTRKGRLRFAPSEGYRLIDREISAAIVAPARDLLAEDVTPWMERRLRASFEDRAHAQGRPLFTHKFTGWPRAGFLARIFPGAKFIHVVRDGRAVANSFLQMPWWRGYAGPDEWGWGPLPESYREEWEESGRSFAVLAGIQWKMLIDAFEACRVQFPPDRWREIRYEDFVADPRGETAELLEFLQLEWTPAFESGFRRYTFATERTEAYRLDLGIHEVAMLDACLADPLEAYGYASPARFRGHDRKHEGQV
jgi:hypothetical protein